MKKLGVLAACAALTAASGGVIAGSAGDQVSQMRQSFEPGLSEKAQTLTISTQYSSAQKQQTGAAIITASLPLTNRVDSSGYSADKSISIQSKVGETNEVYQETDSLKAGDTPLTSLATLQVKRYFVPDEDFGPGEMRYTMSNVSYCRQGNRTFTATSGTLDMGGFDTTTCYTRALQFNRSGTVRVSIGANNVSRRYNNTNCYGLILNGKTIKQWCYYGTHRNKARFDIAVKNGDQLRFFNYFKGRYSTLSMASYDPVVVFVSDPPPKVTFAN